MQYVRYGQTDAEVSRVGFGGMRFDMKNSDAENADIVRYAFDNGINYLDTAPGYSEDKSEIIFGKAVEQMKSQRDRFYISTKGMPTEFDTADKAVKAVEKSLSRLKCDKIDFYHVWCIRRMDQYKLAMQPGGQYEGLMKCKDKGLIENIVVSSHLPGMQIKEILDSGNFKGVLLGYNILNFRYRWPAAKYAYENGYGVVAMNPLGGGVIPQNEKSLSFLSIDGMTPTESALRFCISCPQITVTLNGFTTREHIDTACRVEEGAREFSDEDIAQIRSHLSDNMDRLCTGCGYCLEVCPKEIPIAGYMQYYNEMLLNNKPEDEMVEGIDFQHNWGLVADRKADATECIKCGRCENACTQHLDLIARLETVAAWEQKHYKSKNGTDK